MKVEFGIVTVAVALALAVTGCDESDGDSGADGDAGAGSGGTSGGGAGGSAAGGNGGSGTGGGGNTNSGEFTAAMTAAEGGTLESDDGQVRLTVPAGALAEDTTLSVSINDAANGSQSAVYDFGPDGLEFLMPVTLDIEFAGTPPEGQMAAIAVEEGGEWVALAGSALADGRITAPVEHFSRFAVVWVDGGFTATGCGVEGEYMSCGGDPTGAWTITGGCLLGGNFDPFDGMCMGATFEVDWIIEGSVNFADGMVTTNFTRQVFENTSTVPKDCFPQAMGSCEPFAMGGSECEDTGDACACTSSMERPGGEETSTYRIDGNDMIFDEGTDDEQRVSFCVSGDSISIFIAGDEDDDDFDVVFEATR